ncbi:PREDICTED: putative defensin-like protein 60 [Camelina sativa]|uniref:Defensin-like protein 60 n=1 Tax=Camelina sativa TaxID=90675 RepID=A0ABM1RSW0_CAMSA|nr:PREDICTED: putative defensin-like protein 60 [Camelina sativa]
MMITKTSVIFFLVVILTNSPSNSDVLASPVFETSKNDVCTIPCSTRYGNYECWFDCTDRRYKDGECVNGRCCCKT